ncbi:MAG: hypothetical protein LKF99_03730 [Bifidobacterium sp.]|nr:hypothetical protein [Bifidobacterium sp.]
MITVFWWVSVVITVFFAVAVVVVFVCLWITYFRVERTTLEQKRIDEGYAADDEEAWE